MTDSACYQDGEWRSYSHPRIDPHSFARKSPRSYLASHFELYPLRISSSRCRWGSGQLCRVSISNHPKFCYDGNWEKADAFLKSLKSELTLLYPGFLALINNKLLKLFFVVLWKLWEIDVLLERGGWWIHDCSRGTQGLEAASLIYLVLLLEAWRYFQGYKRRLCLCQDVEGGSLNSCFGVIMVDVFSREDESDDAWHVMRQG